jgi:hypothetical protein
VISESLPVLVCAGCGGPLKPRAGSGRQRERYDSCRKARNHERVGRWQAANHERMRERERAGVPWATPYTGRRTCISLQIHAGVPPVTVAALAGNSPDIIWRHYAREFDHSRTSPGAPLADVLEKARAEVSRSPVMSGRGISAELR